MCTSDDLPVLGYRVVVFGLIDQLAPPVVHKEFVASILVRVFQVDVGVEVLDGEDIVQVVAVWGDDIRENKVVVNGYGVRDFTGAAESAVDVERYVVVAPRGVGVRGGNLRGVGVAIAKVPKKRGADIVENVLAGVALEFDGAIGLLEQGNFRYGSEFRDGLRIYMDAAPLDDGIAAAIGGGGPKCDGIGAGLVDFKGRRLQQRGVCQCAVFVQNHPRIFTIQIGRQG